MRKAIGSAVLVAGAALAVGCASSEEKPYRLTGEKQQMSASQQLRYTDSKGHYRPEHAARGEVINPMVGKEAG